MVMRTEIRRDYNIGINYNYQFYYVTLGNDEIETVVTRDPREVEAWINNTRYANNCRLDRLIVGLDIEWTPHFYPNSNQTVATLQLSVGKRCLIYQIYRSSEVPFVLRAFLWDSRFTFVGVGIAEDVNKLRRDYDLTVTKTRDLCSWAGNELGREEELSRAGLKKLVKEVIGEDMDKPKNVTLSKWDNYCLTEAQVLYACGDAYFSFELGRRLSAWY